MTEKHIQGPLRLREELKMGEKRRDRKGRVLRTGESQRPDGRYQYKYTDPATRKPRLVYSWKLEPTDRTPGGKKEGPSLRELEKAIQRDTMALTQPVAR